jgi:hypothetical protein
VFVLYIHEALYFGDRMSHTLLCPNRLRATGWKGQDVPKQFDAESAHAIIDPTGTLRTPLEMSGVISYLPMWRLTDEELETCVSYDLTSDIPWEPYSPSFREWEQRTASEAATETAADSTNSASTEEAQPSYVAADHMDVDPFDDGNLLERLIGSVRLMDNGTQRTILSVRLVLDGSESTTEGAEGAGTGAGGAGTCAGGAEPEREESAVTRSATQPLVTMKSLEWKPLQQSL